MVSGTIPGNSQRGCWYYQFPENVARRSWRPGILYQVEYGGPRGPVCTRAVGTDVVQDDYGCQGRRFLTHTAARGVDS